MKQSQNGNAFVFVLLGIVLFGLLSYTLINSAKTGQGNLTQHQAGLKAQELLNFLSITAKAAEKLQTRGCSVSDISFANSYDKAAYITSNHSPTAPVDNTCHVFNAAGGNLNMDQKWMDYQNPLSTFTAVATAYDNIDFRLSIHSISNVGTAANERIMLLHNVQTDICNAYNLLISDTIDTTTIETSIATDTILGNQNATITSRETFCVRNDNAGFSSGPSSIIVYAWATN